MLLYNKDADGVNTSEVTITFADGTTVFTTSENKLVGTTAPTYVEANEYYGLKGNKFVKVNEGTVPAEMTEMTEIYYVTKNVRNRISAISVISAGNKNKKRKKL